MLNKLEEKIILKKDIRGFKKIYKEHRTPQMGNLHIQLYKKLFDKIHNFKRIKFRDNKKSHHDELITYYLTLSRVYQLNKESIYLFKNNYFHSIICLTRRAIELFILSLYLHHFPNQIPIFSGRTKNYLKNTRKMIDALKKKDINYEAFSLNEELEIKKGADVLDMTFKDWKLFSEEEHPSAPSFAPNVFIFKKGDKIAQTYRDSKETEPKQFGLFLDKPNFSLDDKNYFLVKFMNYCYLTHHELENFLKEFLEEDIQKNK